MVNLLLLISVFVVRLFNLVALTTLLSATEYKTVVGDGTACGSLAGNGLLSITNLHCRDNIKFSGKLLLEKCTIDGNLQVHGMFVAKGLQCNGAVKVFGKATVESSVLLKTAEFRGKLLLKDSKIYKLLTIHTDSMWIEGSVVQDIAIKHKEKMPKLFLQNTVAKNVSFIDKPGAVYLDSSSHIDGTITNGKLIKQH